MIFEVTVSSQLAILKKPPINESKPPAPDHLSKTNTGYLVHVAVVQKKH